MVLTNADSGLNIVGATTNASASSTYTSLVRSDSPLAYYRLGEPSGGTAANATGHGLDGTYTGGITLNQTGAIANDPDKAISFNGTSGYISLPNSVGNFSNGFTFEIWVYPTAINSWQKFFDFGNGVASDNLYFGSYQVSSSLVLQGHQGADYVSSYLYAPNALELNKWQHFAVSIDPAGNAAMYKNGVLIASGNAGAPNNVTRTKNYIGKSNWASDGYFAGAMDEVAIYNRVLQPVQLRRHYGIAVAKGTYLDRGNGSSGSYAIELQNADNVTLSNLNITGAYDGIHTTSTSSANASSYLTISNSTLFANANSGVNLDSYSDHPTLGNDQAWGCPGGATTSDDQPWGFYVLGAMPPSTTVLPTMTPTPASSPWVMGRS